MPEKFSFPEKQRGATTQKSPQYFSFSSTLLIFFRQVPATHTHTHSINAFYLAWIGGGGETSVCVCMIMSRLSLCAGGVGRGRRGTCVSRRRRGAPFYYYATRLSTNKRRREWVFSSIRGSSGMQRSQGKVS